MQKYYLNIVGYAVVLFGRQYFNWHAYNRLHMWALLLAPSYCYIVKIKGVKLLGQSGLVMLSLLRNLHLDKAEYK